MIRVSGLHWRRDDDGEVEVAVACRALAAGAARGAGRGVSDDGRLRGLGLADRRRRHGRGRRHHEPAAQLIDLSRLDAGALTPERGDVVLGALFARIRAEFAPQAAARGLSLTTCRRASSYTAIRRCSNASSAISSPTASATRTAAACCSARGAAAGAIAIDVVDTGIGIAPAHRLRIFEEFYRVRDDERSAPARRGHGPRVLRSCAASRICSEHEIALESREGAGSRFRVLVPPSVAATPRPQRASAGGVLRRAGGFAVVRRPRRRGRRRRRRDARCDADAIRDVGRDGRLRRRDRVADRRYR